MQLKNIWQIILLLSFSISAFAQNLTGAGSSFAAPMYAAVNEKLGAKHQFKVNYTSVGSAEGIKRIEDRAVDFGASDRPLSRNELSTRGLLQFPTAIGGIVITANLPGLNIAQVKLDGAILADIYLGKIARWDDSRLATLNPGINFPKAAIRLLVREPGSGSTFLFTSYLSKTSATWKDGAGISSNITPAGASSAKGNGGMAQAVAEQVGAIGYIEYGYAIDNKLPAMQLKNAFGSYVSPSAESVSAAVRAADWELLYIDPKPSFEINTINVACPSCWPIVGLTFVLVPRKWASSDKADAFSRFLESLLGDGDAVLKEENYVPLPSRAKNLVRVTLRSQMQDAKGNRLRSEGDSNAEQHITALLQVLRSI